LAPIFGYTDITNFEIYNVNKCVASIENIINNTATIRIMLAFMNADNIQWLCVGNNGWQPSMYLGNGGTGWLPHDAGMTYLNYLYLIVLSGN